MADNSMTRRNDLRARVRSRRLLCGASLAAVLACAPLSAQAEDRYWDANGTGVGSGGTGTWNLGNLNWSPNGDGVSGPFVEPWVNGDFDDAIFGGTAGTVTVGVPVTVGNITFSSAGYVLSGSTITLGGADSTITTLSGNSQIDSILAGANGLIKAGNGALILNGANGFSGDININAGSLYAAADSALGAAGNNIFTAAASNVRLSIGGAGTARTVTIGNGGNLILEGSGAGSALIAGNGSVSVAASGVTMSNDASTYTGRTVFSGCNGVCSVRFTSIGDLGQASSLGAPVTVEDGTIVFNQQSQYSDSVIYLGDGDSSNRNWDINGNGAQIRNQGTGTLELTGNIDISAGGSFNAESADIRLLGVLSGGAYGFNALAERSIELGDANSFTGQATLAGEIRLGKLADIGSESSLGAGTTIGLSNGTLSYTGAGDASNREWLINGAANIIRNDGAGALDLSGALVFNAGNPNPDTLTFGGNFAGTSFFSGAMSGNGNIVADSAGTWVVGGANVQRGTVTVNGGTLRAGVAGAFGNATGFIVNGGTLDLDGYDLVAPSLTGTGGTVALGSANLIVDTVTDDIFSGIITGTGGLTKAGKGFLTLRGANSYTGATTVNGGLLVLDFLGGPATNIISSASTLNMAGGSLTVFGDAGESNIQTFNGLNILAGNNRVGAQASSTGSVTINFGAINRSGGLVDFALPVTGNFTTSNASLGGWATVNGTDYAKVVGGNIVAFTDADYTDQDDASLWADGQYISDSDGDTESFFGTVASDVQLAGLQFTTFDPTTTVTIDPTATLGIDGTIIVATSVGGNSQTITGGSLTGGSGSSTLGVQQNSSGTFTIESTIVDNGGATSFAKAGSGTVRLTGVNSYSGGTTLSGGRLEVASIADGGVNSSIGASSAGAANLVLESGTFSYIGGVDAVSNRGMTLVDGGAERTIEIATGRTVEFSGLVTSPDEAGFTKAGAGMLTLANAANDYVGVTTVAGGTLAVNTLADGGIASGIGAASNASENLVLTTGGQLRYTGGTVATDRGFTLAGGNGRIDVAQAGTTLTIRGVATGAGYFLKDGAGTLVLDGTNTMTGDTIVTAGTLRAGSTRAFGFGGRYMTVNTGATLDLGGYDIYVAAIIGGGLVDLGGQTLTTAGGPGVFTGRITGTGGFTRGGGSYTQTIGGCNNDYTGVTTISSGLAIDCIANGGQASAIGASSAAASNLVLAGGTLAYTGASASTDRGFALTGNGAINVVDPGTVLEFAGNVTGGGQLAKTGAGTLLLSGTNSSTGSLRIINGTVRAGSTTALGSGPLSLDNTAGVLLDLNGYNNNALYLIGGGALGGNIVLGGATLTINSGGSAAAVYGGTISGSGGLVKNGGSYQELSGCASSYDGATVINAGTLGVACLEDGGANSSIGASSGAASNLVINGGALRYVGTGGTTNRQFTLGASTTSKLDASGTGAIAFTHAGPLTFASANTAQTLTLGGTNTGDNVLAAQITNNGSGITRLTKTDAGTWVLTNAGSTYTGVTTISGGVLGVDKLADGGLASGIGASSAAASNLVIGNGSTLRYTGAGDTTNRLFTLSQGVTFIESSGTGAIVFTDTGPVTLANNNQARTIALGGTNTGNNTLAGSIGNAGSGVTTLAKNDSGTWVLTGNHSYTGSTNINGGTLFVGGGGTTGSIASALVNNFGTLGFHRSDLLAYGGQIVGTGALRQAGTGTTVLTGNNSYTGGTTIDAGTLQLGDGGTSGSIVGDVANDGVLVFDRSNLVNFAGIISGNGAVRQIGSGTTVLTGINSYSDGTSILGGTLQVSADANLGAAAGGLTFSGGTLRTTASFASARNASLTGAGTISTDAGTTFSLDGLISGTGGLTKSGAGLLTLSGNNSYAGATNVNAGTLRINGDQSAATGLVTVASGATLGGAGTIGGSVNVLNGGILAPGNSPGTLNIDGNLSLAGGSVLNFEFGEAGVAGGALNDLINVGGDLTLDGTINVTSSSGGYFGGGIYRVFNYAGTLTDNGLALGSMPVGSDVTVQTSVAGQVNLINSDGLSLSFWDGGTGPKFNDLVDGGDGNWHLGGADNNWTGADGAINAAYADGSFAVFAGAPGTVAVDNSGGAVTATGMQFATDAYRIAGDDVTLIGPQAVIRVGDGTGAGYTATIDANLTGSSQLVKTDAGKLVLNGFNSYSGGTAINGGSLEIASDLNLGDAAGGLSFNGGTLAITATMTTNRDITLEGAGLIANVAGATVTLGGDITGTGSLTITTPTSVTLTGDATHSGGTTIGGAGSLVIGDGGTTGSILGDVVNNSTLTFNRSDAYAYSGSIIGTGNLSVIGNGEVTLTGDSNYAGTTAISNVGSGLRVADGAIVTSGGATTLGRTTLTVDGANSAFSTASLGSNTIGAGATGVNVTNGGTLRVVAGDLSLRAAGGSIQVDVDGANSLADVSGGIFGSAATNAPFSMTISAGGELRTGGASQIGTATSSTNPLAIAITGAGSNWTSTGSLLMTAGDFTVDQGGAASFASASFGTAPQAANLSVSGGGSNFATTGDLVIGSGAGTGAFALTDDGQATVGSLLTIAQDAGSNGTVTVGDGGVLRIVGGTLAMGLGNAVLNIGDRVGVLGARAGTVDVASISFAATGNRVNFNHVDTDYVFSARMSGAGSVESNGPGVTILTADNAYTGSTDINSGTLIVNGDQSGATGFTNVNPGGTLGGTGIIGGAAIVSGRIAPGDVGEAPGTLTINGNLFNFSTASLDYNFGQANVVGGAYNDLIEVGGNLTLDGTLNVAVTPGGSFDPGVYRVINYGGTLTDNGLNVDPAYYVQTSVANQVNLVNTTGLTMRFWDGAAGGKNDGAITGGDGLWQNSSGNDNWTEYDGSANAPFTDDAFAVFSGLGGTVSVDGSLGAITASGMQFASDGYLISGDDVALVAPESIIRVGDGTAAGATYTAMIATNLTGVGDFLKTDFGTLVLTGASGIAGDVYVRDGELRLADGGTLTSANGFVGPDAGNAGVVTVAGSDGVGNASTWTVGDLTVGYGGTGTLNITDGGHVVSTGGVIGLDSGGIGEVIVAGPGSSWENGGRISVGLFGSGILRIEDGATVSSNDGVVGGSGQGDIIVSGPGSAWANAAQLNIGSFGAGTMRIEDGASVTSNQGYIGANADGSVTVTGAGSNWLVTDFSMTVGNAGAGALTIEDGGRVRAEGGFALGAAGGSSGTVILLGTPGNRGTLETGQIGAGLGTVAFTMDGGVLRATQDAADFFTGFGARDITLGANSGFIDTDGHDIGVSPAFTGAGGLTKEGAGILTLTGASSYTGSTLVNAGTLLVNGDQSAATGLTTVFSGATLGGNGIIGGNVDIRDGAILAPGESAGTLTVGGNLSLAGGSILAYEFGQAGVAGGALNDLVNVGGDLVLDGTINVSASAGGTFGPGLYRVFNYGGALTDNGLELGAIAGGTADILVQTSVAGQVNLVSTQGLTLGFWDGLIGPKNNGQLDGGDGVWRLGGGSNNWTDANGAVNADYAQDSFAVFAGTAGTVAIDDVGGDVLASGMQFASDGYVVTGDALTLTGAQATVQVGDSSTAGANYTATIAAELTGTAGLLKTDAGTLVLTGANSYTGGTTISDGTLQIGSGGTNGSIVGDIVNDGTLVVDRAGTYLLDGAISGTGLLAKRGSGLLELTGANSYAGGTLVDGGTVRVSSDASLGDAAGILSLQGGILQAGASFTSARSIAVGSGDANSIDVQGFDVTLTGTISDGPGNQAGNFLNKRGTGTLTLSGVNTYTNRTVVQGGTLALAGAGTLGARDLNLFADTVFDVSQSDGNARLNQFVGDASSIIALGGTNITLGSGSSISRWAGTITDGGIGGGTGGSVEIVGAFGAVRFQNANSYTGGTVISSGKLALDDNGALYAGGAVTVNAGAEFDIAGLTGAGTTIGDLSGAGSVVLGDKALTFGTANDTVLAGPISGSGGALVKQGTGIFTLGGANGYTGATDVLAGTLLVNGDQSAATGLTSVASGATLGGFGIIGGDVTIADGATLAPGASGPGALTINGNLALASGATLDFEFGQANSPGGLLNDVVNVGGDLTLDGTLDVAVPAGGAFDIGLYRIANYAGSLTDNGLALGTLPAGADVAVQTSIAGEVNLVNTGSATLNFWDGAAGPKFDNAVNGGDGVWQNSLGNDNWADIGGAVNAGYDDGAFAIFSGAAGSVTIDNSLGAVSASGMQFAAGGYVITGDALTLDGAQAVIRVGDGTAPGAAYVATIDAELTGAAELVKTDAGTLVLTGANSYAGGTSINGGTLQVGGDANLGTAAGGLRFDGGTLQTTASFTSSRGVELLGTGGFRTDAGTMLTLSGALSGAGSFAKSGAGTLVLDGGGTFGGATVAAGTMLVEGNYAATAGTTNVLADATLGGTGTIGGNVALGNGAILAPGAGAPGTLTIGGNLSLSATSQLDFEFGEADVAGGALNDLVNVGGDLVLDGVLNVGVPAGGAFDVGVYRMFNYGGALIDNGVTFGTMPAGANAQVQTSIAGQVNLVNSEGLALNFWDGAAGPKNNGAINGGDGVWQSGLGNDNWTGEDGAVNAAYSDGAFAIFGGRGGAVTVDDSLGTVSVVGMQFAADGYVIGGDGITLDEATATIRVGDGSTAGAGFTATIDSALGGAAQLVKSDSGTLVLGGTNSYTGGTLIAGGTLRISSDANLGAAGGDITLDGGTLETSATLTSARDIEIASAGTISTAADTVFTSDGLFSGVGALTKNGAGTLLLTANSSGFGGSTTVAGGTLAVQGDLGGAVIVNSAGRLEGTGRVGSLANAGVVAPGGSIGSLTVAGDYIGTGGVLEIEAELGGDSSLADRLIVGGATSGTTRVTVTNRGGLGAQTVEGIKIIDVVGASNGNFALDGDYLFDGEQAVIAGAYGYRLYKNGIATPQDGDWYLRSALLDGPNEPQGPLYQPGVPLYENYGQVLQSLGNLPTLQERVGNRQWARSDDGANTGIWGRMESTRARPQARVSTAATDANIDSWKMQIGVDRTLSETGDGTLVAGITGHYGESNASVRSIFGDGGIEAKAYGAGVTATWYHRDGFYADAQAQFTWFDGRLQSSVLGTLVDGNDGTGKAFSLELGKRAVVGNGLTVTPQIQMSYQDADFDSFTDPSGARVSSSRGDSLRSRWGISLDHQKTWQADGTTRRSHLYGLVNLSYEWLDGTAADVSGTAIRNANDRLRGELALGGSLGLNDRVTIYTQASASSSFRDFGDDYSVKATAGVRVAF